VRPTDGVEPIVETVDAPTPIVEEQAPEEQAIQAPMETERNIVDMEGNIVLVDPCSLPDSTAATIAVARHAPAERSGREQANHIMMTLELAMEKVYVWANRVEAQSSETAECDVAVWKRQFGIAKSR
jgi:hypothetical protein